MSHALFVVQLCSDGVTVKLVAKETPLKLTFNLPEISELKVDDVI